MLEGKRHKHSHYIIKDFIKKRFHKYECLDDVMNNNHKTLDDLVLDEDEELNKAYREKFDSIK